VALRSPQLFDFDGTQNAADTKTDAKPCGMLLILGATCDPHYLNPVAFLQPSPRHVRLWQDDRLLKHNSMSLKKQHVGNESVLTIQILDAPDDESSDGMCKV